MEIIVAGSKGVKHTKNGEFIGDSEIFCIEYGLTKLYSFLSEKKHIEKWNDKYKLMVDSGAHSWNKKHDHIGMSSSFKLKPPGEFMGDYFDFIKKHKHKKFTWVEFDVYKDLPIQEIDSFYKMISKIGISGEFIRVYHHYLDPEPGNYDTLKKWMKEGQRYIGMGADNMDNFDDIFLITKDRIKLHGFALTRLSVIERYPFYSVDSTSPLSTVIFGRYTKPVMGFKEKSDVLHQKSIECFQEDHERLENAIIEVKKTEEYITKLWEKNGLVW